MNNHDYKRALGLREQYLKTKEEFEKHHGIIQPIRAVVLDITDYTVPESVNARLAFLGEKISDVMVSCRQMVGEEFTASSIKEFNKLSRPVGYICSVLKNDHIEYGLAYCNDADFDEFKGDFGKLLAMQRAMTSGIDLAHVMLDVDYVNSTKGSHHIYLWPITYGEQIQYFVKRTHAYYKNEEN